MPAPAQTPALIIVGGSGFIGSRLVERFSPDYRVFSLDNKEPRTDLPGKASFLEIDVTSDESVTQTIDRVFSEYRGPFASLLQLAAYYNFGGGPSDLYEKVTVRGTQRVLRAVHDRALEQFVFSSTMLAHKASRPGVLINEDHPLEGKWEYPQSKIKTERIIEDEHGSLPAVLLRIAGVYTDQCDSIPLTHQMQRIYEDRLTSHVFPGNTDHGQSFVHVDDVVEAFWKTVENRGKIGREVVPILIGEPETLSYDTLQREFGRMLRGEQDWRTQEIPKAVAKSGAWLQDRVPGVEDPFIQPWMIDLADDRYELDISRARELIGWLPQHSLRATLPAMCAALKNDPTAWYERHDLKQPEGAGTPGG